MVKYHGFYRALVVDNLDVPAEVGGVGYLGRIRCIVYPMMANIQKQSAEGLLDLEADAVTGLYSNTDILPWCVPCQSILTGAGEGYGSFSIPAVGSYVWVFFEEGDIRQPVYFGSAPTAVHGIPSEVTEPPLGSLPGTPPTNYPYKIVYKTKGGVTFEIDDTTPKIKIKMDGVTLVSIDALKIQIKPIEVVI